jgi:uridine kinase
MTRGEGSLRSRRDAPHPGVHLIGITGPTCAGKTELSRRLAARLTAAILPLDAYYHDLSAVPITGRGGLNFDEPSALDHDLFVAHLRALHEGKEIGRPIYDFSTHSRTDGIELVRPGRVLIVEGLFVLYWEDVRALMNTRVFVDLPDRACLERRIVRDVRERGRTRESVARQFEQTVQPMAERYVRPTLEFADLVVGGNDPLESSVERILRHIER